MTPISSLQNVLAVSHLESVGLFIFVCLFSSNKSFVSFRLELVFLSESGFLFLFHFASFVHWSHGC